MVPDPEAIALFGRQLETAVGACFFDQGPYLPEDAFRNGSR
jgi:hypothetical protein